MRFYFAYLPKKWAVRRKEWSLYHKKANFMAGKNLWRGELYNVRWLFKLPLVPYALYEKRVVCEPSLIAHGDRPLPPHIAAQIKERLTDPRVWQMPLDELRKAAGL